MSSRSARSKEVFELLRNHRAKPSSWILLRTLESLEHEYINKDGEFFRSVRDLCEDSGLSIQSTINALRELKKIGLIDYRRGLPDDFAAARQRGKKPSHVIKIRR